MNKEYVRVDYPSYAAIELSCTSADDPIVHAMMRVYVQIAYTNTELEDSDICAKQEMKFKPGELKAFRILSENGAISSFTPRHLCDHKSKQDTSGLPPSA
ncbi:hypothetical protein N7466_001977 [Penicillium verhagenii]|uniref:uncharacterized protein n=1 Tax=Penicillium verhagenii TaxID=1562060 RepID=UPI0025455F34|nr:uncharacterized protein N7466_001977 [Penicillium verhagenii]KAJ5938843.1 hypothetical protein N7466_001977 [Penicillium verhagenii]